MFNMQKVWKFEWNVELQPEMVQNESKNISKNSSNVAHSIYFLISVVSPIMWKEQSKI